MIASSTGDSWLNSETRPIVPNTADRASSSGRPAATSEPKATMRISSVTGSDSVSAFLKSSSKTSPSALPALASPNCSMRRSGFARCAAATAASGASTRSSVTSKSPASWKETSAERPSFAIWPALPAAKGDWTWVTCSVFVRRRSTSATAALNAASRVVASPRDCTRTVSSAWRGKWSNIALSARPASPGPFSCQTKVFRPAAPPPTAAMATKASQPKMAILRCAALQRPARAAKFRGGGVCMNATVSPTRPVRHGDAPWTEVRLAPTTGRCDPY